MNVFDCVNLVALVLIVAWYSRLIWATAQLAHGLHQHPEMTLREITDEITAS